MLLRHLKFLAGLGCALTIAGCSTFLPASGPKASEVVEGPSESLGHEIRVLELSEPLIRRIAAAQHRTSLAESLGPGTALPPYPIQSGDTLEVSVWEAPPAALFGNGVPDVRGVLASSRVPVLPEQVVNSSGDINMPFAGTIHAAGVMPEQLEKDIALKLKKKANDPQVVVRVLRSPASAVTIIGEVNSASRLPLSPRGERLLDALASSGGLRQPVGKITIQVTREKMEHGKRSSQVAAESLDAIIANPSQNIMLQPGDVITVLHQPNSFTILGATTRNEEISFEAQGISLAQALARAGGLQDQRANATGVFVFRFEDPSVLGDAASGAALQNGKVPVIYRADLKDPATFFLAQNFPIRNKDMMYVANAQGAELQKFVNLLSGVVVPVLTINNLTN